MYRHICILVQCLVVLKHLDSSLPQDLWVNNSYFLDFITETREVTTTKTKDRNSNWRGCRRSHSCRVWWEPRSRIETGGLRWWRRWWAPWTRAPSAMCTSITIGHFRKNNFKPSMDKSFYFSFEEKFNISFKISVKHFISNPDESSEKDTSQSP